jgi:hypothetical protein
LIAAGHPRLSFELAAYQALMPKHWNESAKLRREPDQELKLWMLGQIKSAKVAADIAVARAEAVLTDKRPSEKTQSEKKSSEKTPVEDADHNLPRQVILDLAEFECHACHHDLSEKTGRGRLSINTLSNSPDNRPLRKKLGEPQWGSWSIVSATWFARESKLVLGRDQSAAENSLAQWTQLMQSSQLRGVPAHELATAARQTNADLTAWSRTLESSQINAAQARLLIQRLLATESDSAFAMTWDRQAQRYLALVAAHQSLRDLTMSESSDQVLPSQTLLPPPLIQMPNFLRFPHGFATPHDYRAEQVQQLFQQLRP